MESRPPRPDGRVGMPNQALEQTRDSVLRYSEVVCCELLNLIVRGFK
jgi:hypothetical protein